MAATFHSRARIALLILGKVLLFCPLFLGGCAAKRESATSPFFPTGFADQSAGQGDEVSYWDDNRSGGKPRIVIDLDEQRAYFYRSDQLVGVSIVSTGREGYNTPSGEFHVTQKDLKHVSSIYGDYVNHSGQVVTENVDVTKDARPPGTVFRGAPMPYFLRIQGGIGMHAGYLPGYPASHGCIRLPKQMAIRFFQNAGVGTPVVIRQQAAQEYVPISEGDQNYEPLTSIIQR
jgi:L,D-transpeptidase catalytic domain